MIVNPVAALRCAQRRVDYHRQTDRKAPKQTKDYSDNLKVSYFNSRASRSTAEVGLPFMHKAHQLERVTCIREIYKSPVIRLQSGLRDFFFQNAVKNRIVEQGREAFQDAKATKIIDQTALFWLNL